MAVQHQCLHPMKKYVPCPFRSPCETLELIGICILKVTLPCFLRKLPIYLSSNLHQPNRIQMRYVSKTRLNTLPNSSPPKDFVSLLGSLWWPVECARRNSGVIMFKAQMGV